MGKMYAYIRISSKDQNEARQRIAMREHGVPEKCIYMDSQSGKDFNRPGYQRMVNRIREGDTLVIKSIDRLGRNYEQILEQWRYLTREKKVGITVLDMPLLDIRVGENENDLTGTLISDIVLELLSYVAETERAFIRQRQAEGIAAAIERGVRFGREAMVRPPECDNYIERYRRKEISARRAAKELGISHTTFLKWEKIED